MTPGAQQMGCHQVGAGDFLCPARYGLP